MTDYAKIYPNLSELLNFLHQDWKIMFEWEGNKPDYETAIRKLKVANLPAVRQNIISELAKLISCNFDEEKLEEIVNDDFGSAFYPPGVGLTYQNWLNEILRIFEEPVEKTKREFLPKFVGER